jgi:branched-chain amino acid transport system substrate-binding protein
MLMRVWDAGRRNTVVRRISGKVAWNNKGTGRFSMYKNQEGGSTVMSRITKTSIITLMLFAFVSVFSLSNVVAADEKYPGINAPWTAPKATKFKGTITIGDASDITGPAGKSASQMSQGLADWLRYQNEYLGGVEGYKIEAQVVDTKFDSQNLINTYNRFIDEGKVLIYSGVGYCVPATTEVCNRRKVPTIGSSGTVTQAIMTPDEAKKRDNYFFQMSPVTASRMDILVKFCMDDWKKKGKKGKPRFGTFMCDTQNGHEAATAVRIYATKLGGEFTIHTFHAPSITDAKSQVTALRNAKVDYILNGPDYDQPLTVFALELQRQTTKSWKPTYVGHTDFATAYIDTKNKAFEGHYSYQYCLDWADVNEPIVKWVREINKMWHPNVKDRPFLYMTGVQAGMVISETFKRAIQKYGDPAKLDGVKVRETMETLKGFDPMGISGKVTYSQYDHQGVTSLRIAECKNKTMVPATKFIEADPLEPAERDGKYWLKD